jgi:acylaminoacyl-peptidase
MRAALGQAALLVLLLQLSVGQAADDPPSGKPAKHQITVDDYFTLGMLGEVAISPDGTQVAYTEGRWQESTNDRKSDIWIVPANGGSSTRLTQERGNYSSLRWSPDGKSLYFTHSRKGPGDNKQPPFDGSTQVWRLTRGEREPTAITRVAGGVNGFDLARAGDWLIYTTSSDADDGDWSKLRDQFSGLKYGTRKRTKTQVFRLDLGNWRTTRLVELSRAVDDFALSPDGQKLAAITGSDGEVITLEGQSKLTIVNLNDGAMTDLPDDLWRKQAPSPYGRIQGVKWSADSKALAFAVGFDGYPGELFVAVWQDAKPPQIKKIARPGDVSLHGGVDGGIQMQWRGDSRDLCFLGDDRSRVRIYCVENATGNAAAAKSLTPDEVVVDAFAWDQAGKAAAAIIGSPGRMHDVHLLEGSKATRLTNIHAHTREWSLPRISVVRWMGAKGKPVEGVLELPPDYVAGKPLPLIVNLHGGPTAAWPCSMLFGFSGSVLFAGNGYAYFSPNYRGSTGYGDAFLTELVGHENEIELEDIQKGVDYLIAEKVADKDNLGVAGWSNGGYLTNCLISKTSRFRAASSGAGIADVIFEWGGNDEPAYPMVLKGGPPWKVPDEYRRTSPIFDFGKVTTPTIFHVGEEDLRCPKAHCQMAHRALKEYLGVDTELVIYPGEAHGPVKYASRKAKLTWDLAWFDHYLKRKPKP